MRLAFLACVERGNLENQSTGAAYGLQLDANMVYPASGATFLDPATFPVSGSLPRGYYDFYSTIFLDLAP